MEQTVEIIRCRRKTVQIRVCSGGRIEVRAPGSLGDREIGELLRDRAAWIERKVALVEAGEREKARWTFQPGSTML